MAGCQVRSSTCFEGTNSRTAFAVSVISTLPLRDLLLVFHTPPSDSAFLLDRYLRDLGDAVIEVCGDEMTHCNGADAQRD